MQVAVDTNIVVRFLTRDDEQQYHQTYALFQRPRIYISNTVFLETEWVLRYAYAYQASDIIRAFKMLLGLPNVEAEDPGRIAIVLTWHQAGLDFADALHLASSQHCDEFYTFDRDFVKKGKDVSSCVVKKPEE
jgi:predicted nucleic-acid-binding protein